MTNVWNMNYLIDSSWCSRYLSVKPVIQCFNCVLLCSMSKLQYLTQCRHLRPGTPPCKSQHCAPFRTYLNAAYSKPSDSVTTIWPSPCAEHSPFNLTVHSQKGNVWIHFIHKFNTFYSKFSRHLTFLFIAYFTAVLSTGTGGKKKHPQFSIMHGKPA